MQIIPVIFTPGCVVGCGVGVGFRKGSPLRDTMQVFAFLRVLRYIECICYKFHWHVRTGVMVDFNKFIWTCQWVCRGPIQRRWAR